MNALLELRDVERTFGSGATAMRAVDGVSFDINENEFFALLGPSGCGKTTLLRILAGLEEPDAGTITLTAAGGAPADLLAMPVHRRPINLMFQSYALFPHLTVEKNIAYGLQREKLAKAEIRERVGEVLEMVGLQALARRKPAQLSGGQRQRVALARAVVKRPRLLLLDEPLAALDRKVRAQMQTELKRLQNEVGITFVVVTHDQEEAMSMADRVAVMNRGHVEQIASPTELYQRPSTRFVADFIGATNLLDGEADPAGLRLPSGVVVTAPSLVGRAGPAAVSVRPEAVRLGDAVTAGVDAAGADAGVDGGGEHGPAGLAGVVRDVQFFGGISHLLVDVAGIEQPVISSLVGASPRGPGDRVVVWWRAEDCVAVEPLAPEGAH